MSAFLCTVDGRFHCIDPSLTTCRSCCLKRLAADVTGIPTEDFLVTQNGHIIKNDSRVSIMPGDVFRVQPCLLGGKGGFGSMLRAIGAQIEKTTNREACRDLSGRRMRDVNDEKKIAEWVSKQAEKEEEKVRRKQERLARMRAEPKHTFDDRTYTAQIQANAEQIGDALQQGLRAASASAASSVSSPSSSDVRIKRKTNPEQKRAKKSRLWLAPDEEEFESDEGDGLDDVAGPGGEGCCTVTVGNSTSTPTTAGTSTSTSHTRPLDSVSGSSSDSESACNLDYLSKDTKVKSEATSSHPQKMEQKEAIAKKVEENKSHDATDTVVSEHSSDQHKETTEVTPLDLADYSCIAELEALGLERLKSALMALGLKCGGTLQQRAERLFATKGIPLDKLDPSLFAKPSNGKKGKGKKK